MNKLKILFIVLIIFIACSKVCFANEITVERVDFAKNGQKIMKIEEGTVDVTVTVSGESGQKLIEVAALYDGDRIKSCTAQSFVTTKQGENSLAPKIVNGVESDNMLHVYLFGESMQPLCDRVVLSSDRTSAAGFYLDKYDSLMTVENLNATAGLYDCTSGGFYCSYSAKTYNPFAADIESTAQMLDYLKCTGLLWKMPKALKDKFVVFFQQRQSQDDGYFYDPQFGSDVTDSKRERNFTKTADALKWLGAQPLYPLPTERVQTFDVPIQYTSEENFRQWLYALPWETYPYGAGNTLVSSMTTIKAYGYDEIAVDYVSSLQNEETGFWGEGLTYDTLNAAMKISGVYSKSHPFPNLRKAMESTIYVADNCVAPTASSIWNVLMLINTAKNTYADGDEDINAIIDSNLGDLTQTILRRVPQFLQEDGLYAYTPDGNSLQSQSSLVSLGMNEGGVNGNLLCTAYMWIQANWLYKITPDYNYINMAQSYFNTLLNAQPVQKIDYHEILCDDDFNSETQQNTPAVLRLNGNAEIVKRENNDCLAIDAQAGQGASASFVMPSRPILTKLTLSQRIKIENAGSPTGTWYFVWGASNTRNTVELIVSADSVQAGSATIKMRTSDSPSVTQDIGTVQTENWCELKIEYMPKGISDTVTRIYADGVLLLETDKYFNAGDASALPESYINGLTIGKFSYTGGSLLVDDVKITVE